jgi:hypothetical protein
LLGFSIKFISDETLFILNKEIMFHANKIYKIIKINKSMRILASLKFRARKNIKIFHKTSWKIIKIFKNI